MDSQFTLAENVPHDTADKVRQLVFNRYGVKVYKGLASSYSDTDYKYNLLCDKVTKPRAAELTTYILGVIDTVKSY